MRTVFKWISALIILAIAGSLWFVVVPFNQKPPITPAPPTLVSTTQVTIGSLPITVNAIGTIVPIQQTFVSPKQDGYIKKIFFTEGENVTAGQVLIQLDDDMVQANLAADIAQMKFNQSIYERYQMLLNAGGVSRERVEEALSTYQISQAKVMQDKINLANTTLLAPFSGTMSTNELAVGQFVTTGQNLAQIIDQSKFRIEYSVPGRVAKQLKLGQPVKITLPLAQPEIFTGTVTFVAPFIDPQSGTVTVHAVIPAPNIRILSGTFVQVEQTIGMRNHVIMVPEQSIVPSFGNYRVFTIVQGKAQSMTVTLGTNHDGMVEITQGLKPNTTIITAGAQNLRNGQPVTTNA